MRRESRRLRGWAMALFLVLVTGAGVGCVSGRFLPSVRETFAAIPPSKVLVHPKECPPGVRMIGSVIVDASEPLSQGAMVDRLRLHAARAGGHGICKLRYRKTKGGSLLPGAGEYDPSGFRSATCLVYRLK